MKVYNFVINSFYGLGNIVYNGNNSQILALNKQTLRL